MAQPSIIEQRPHSVQFGNVGDRDRGQVDKLINPPISLNDDYFWLRNDKRDSEEILNIIANENKYFEENNDHSLVYDIETEINSRMEKSYETLPMSLTTITSNNKYSYKFLDGKDHPQFVRHNSDDSVTVLLDINDVAYGHKQCDVQNITVNYDESMMSYGVDYNGSECYEIIFINLKMNNQLSNNISSVMENVMYASYFWVNNRIVGYIRENERKQPFELLFYDVISQQTVLVYTEHNSQLNLSAEMNNGGNCIFVESTDYNDTKLQYIMLSPDKHINNDISLEDLQYHLYPICNNIENVLITADYYNGDFYFLTNANDSTNFKITVESASSFNGQILDQTKFKDVIPYNPNVTISSFTFLENKLIFTSTIDGNNYINQYNNTEIYTFNCTNTNQVTHIDKWTEYNGPSIKNDINDIDDENNIKNVYNISLCITVHDAPFLLVKSESMTEPSSIKQVYVNNNFHTEDIIWTKNVPNYDKNLYGCKRLFITAHDGTLIPCSIMFKHEYMTKGNMPIYMYGYGAYGLTIDTLFNYKNISLLDKGYCFAICHVRGGGFMGRQWYEDGRLKNKINTFTDFHDCALRLKSLKWTDGNNITCEGRSAGGLLAGVMASRYPETFTNVIMGVPFVDVMTTMCDSSIPLTTEEWTQWGNPNILEDYQTMIEYCPYNGMKPSNFPNTFITAGFHDPRVQYWEGLKFLAKMRQLNTGTSRLLMETQIGQGHFGNAGRYKANNETAKKFAFVLNSL